MIKLMSYYLRPVEHESGETLGDILQRYVKPGRVYERTATGRIRCHSCAIRCSIPEGKSGYCRVRFVKNGKLYVPWGYVAGLQVDPIEKKPFYHVMPGTDALSFGMLGCDLHCSFCQNWVSSQALRDEAAGTLPLEASPEDLVRLAHDSGSKSVVSTYNEPLITSEWSHDVFELAKKEGLYTAYVSNGNVTEQVIEFLQPVLDFYKVDLKTFNDKNYRKLGTRLERVTSGIQLLKEKKFWVEIVTLIIPGFNDSEEELRDMARFLADVDPYMPWHVTAFHPDYKMTDRGWTPVETLLKACQIGKEEGLHYVYAGNAAGQVGKWENTYCHHCGKLLVERHGFRILKNVIERLGRCPECKTTIPGHWFFK